MDALSLKGFLGIAALVSGVCGVGVAVTALAVPLQLKELVILVIGSVVLGPVVAGVIYIIQFSYDLHYSGLPAGELSADEELVEPPSRTMHFATGNPKRLFTAIGGKLFLTNRRLLFRTHRGQQRYYLLVLRLADIRDVAECQVGPGIPGGLRVVLSDGREEFFNFGIWYAVEAKRWVGVILWAQRDACDQ